MPGVPDCEIAARSKKIRLRQSFGATAGGVMAFAFRCARSKGWARQDSNLGPRDYESPALTAELQAQFTRERGNLALAQEQLFDTGI